LEKTVAVKLTARVSQYLSAMAAASKATTGLATSASGLTKVGASMQSVGANMTRYVSVPLVALGGAATLMASRFETSFAQMVGLANVPASEIDNLRESVLSLSGDTAQAPQDLADALYFAASSGLDSADALDAVEIAAHAAAAGMGSTETVVGLLTGAVGSYGAANLTAAEAADILTSTVREGRAAPEELAGALGRVLPIAASMGISMNEVGAAIAFMTNKGLDADEAVTGLRGVLTHLAAPGKAARDMLEEMGTSAEALKAAIDANGLTGALDLLREHGFNGNAQAMHALMPEVRGLNTLTALLADNSGSLDTIMGRLGDTTGSLDTAFSAVADTSAFKMKQAFADIQVALIQVGAVLLPFVATMAKGIGDLAGWFSDLPGPVQNVAIALAAVAAAAGPVMFMVGGLIKNFQSLAGVVKGADGGLSGLAKTFGVLGAGIAAGLYIYDAFGESQRDADARTREVSDALSQATIDAWNYAAAATGATGAVDPLTIAQLALSNALTGNTEDGQALTQALGALGLQTEDAWSAISGLNIATNEGTPEAYAQFWVDLGTQMGLTGQQLELFAGVMGGTMPMTASQLEDAARAAGFADGEFARLQTGANGLVAASNLLGDSGIATLGEKFLNTASASSELGANLVTLARAQADAAGEGDNTVAVYKNFLALMASLPDEQQNVVLGLGEMTKATEDAGTGVALWSQLWSGAAKQLGVVVGSAKETADALGALTPVVDTLAEAQSALAEISSTSAGAGWVAYATQVADASGSGEDALVVFQALQTVLNASNPVFEAYVRNQIGLAEGFDKVYGAMGPVTKEAGLLNSSTVKAADGIEKIAVAADEATPNLAALVDEMFSMEAAAEDSAQRADQFRESVERLRAPQEDLRSATRDVWTEIEAMSDALDDNGATLAMNTEAGRANQEQLETTRDAIFEHAAALIENGASAEEAANDIAYNVRQLNDQWRAAGATEGQIAALNAQYGLTPEQVTTYLALLGDKEARGQIGAYTSDLNKIPAVIPTYVKPYVAPNDVYTKLAGMTASRSVAITPYLTKDQLYVQIHSNPVYIKGSAMGRYVSRPMISTLGETGPEVVLPLNNPGRMAALLGMSEVGPKVAAAFGGASGGAASGGGSIIGGGDTHVTVNMPPGANGDDVVRALRKWQRQSGPLPLVVR